MRLALAAFILTLPTSAIADTCRNEVLALFDGPLDPFQRPAHRQMTQVFDDTGTLTREMLSIIETPLRTIAGQPSQNWFTMAIDQDVWNGPSPDGPWTNAGSQMPADRAEDMKAAHLDMKANVTDTTCHGADSAGRTVYSFRTQTTPDATGGFFGSYDTITLDPEMNQIVIFDRTDFVNAWTEGVSKERWLIEVEFDPEIKVSAP